jgi:ATP-dependent protease ClpP protease subunit
MFRCETEKEHTEDDEFGDEVVKVQGTDIFFYSSVNSSSISKLNIILKRLERELLLRSVELPGYVPQVTLYIKSEGGDIFEGFSGMDHIENTKLHVTTVADGCCASAATFLFLAGDECRVNRHAYLLIHQISMDGLWGKYEDIKQEVENSDKFMDTIKNIYREKTKIPPKKLDEFMKKDVYLTAQECQKYGII